MGIVEIYNVSARANASRDYEFWGKREDGNWVKMESRLYRESSEDEPTIRRNVTPITLEPYSCSEISVMAFTKMPQPFVYASSGPGPKSLRKVVSDRGKGALLIPSLEADAEQPLIAIPPLTTHLPLSPLSYSQPKLHGLQRHSEACSHFFWTVDPLRAKFTD
jgi:hypothetical protein